MDHVLHWTYLLSGLQTYARKIAACLTKLSTDQDSIDSTGEEMCKWTDECNTLRLFLAAGNLQNSVAFSSSRLDGTMGLGAGQLPDTWYQNLLVGNSRMHCPSVTSLVHCAAGLTICRLAANTFKLARRCF